MFCEIVCLIGIFFGHSYFVVIWSDYTRAYSRGGGGGVDIGTSLVIALLYPKIML
jgi:hypothetical protein